MNLLRWFSSLPPKTRNSVVLAVVMGLFTVWSMFSRPATRAIPIAEVSGGLGTTKSREFVASQTQLSLDLTRMSPTGESPKMTVQLIAAETGRSVAQSQMVESGGGASKRRELSPKTVTVQPGRYYLQVDAQSDGSISWTITVVGIQAQRKDTGEQEPFVGPR